MQNIKRGKSKKTMIYMIPIAIVSLICVIYVVYDLISGNNGSKISLDIISLIVGVANLLLVSFVIYHSKSITKHAEKITEFSDVISNGDLTQVLDINSKDEFGGMAESLNIMAQNLVTIITEMNNNLNKLAATAANLNSSSEKTMVAAEIIGSNIDQISSSNENSLSVSSDAARIAAEISTGMDEVAINIQTVNESASQAYDRAEKGNSVAVSAVNQMSKINEAVSTSSDNIVALGQKSNEIGQIISLITDISEQTNLLALNAAIEAARAGEQGRGFAVVAEEVRKLAEQSNGAASQIASLIGDMQSEITKAVSSMEEGTGTVKEGIVIVDEAGSFFKNILSDIDKISKEMRTVTSTVEEAYMGIIDMVAMIENLANAADASVESTKLVTSSSSEQVSQMQDVASSAQALSEIVSTIEREISIFKL